MGRMIDVEFACCITNSLLLARQRKKERERENKREIEREREKGRMKSSLAYS